jgi:hypothetical protein
MISCSEFVRAPLAKLIREAGENPFVPHMVQQLRRSIGMCFGRDIATKSVDLGIRTIPGYCQAWPVS